jgi:hypothetical protein
MVLLLLLLCKVMPALTNARLRIQQLEYLGLLARLSDEGEKLFAYLCVILVDEPEEELALPRKTLVHVVLCKYRNNDQLTRIKNPNIPVCKALPMYLMKLYGTGA